MALTRSGIGSAEELKRFYAELHDLGLGALWTAKLQQTVEHPQHRAETRRGALRLALDRPAGPRCKLPP
jgi:hypothetical protein